MAYISKRKKLYFITFISVAVICAAIALFVIYVMPKMATVKFVDGMDEQEREIADPITLEKGSTLPEELPSPEKLGHTFDAWYHSKKFNEQVKVKPGVDVVDYDITLYANFIPNEYTVSFDRNGANGGNIPSITQLFGRKITLPTAEGAGISMPNKVLYGWCENPEGKQFLTHKPGVEISMFAKDVTLYAIWGDPLTTVNFVVGDDAEFINPCISKSNHPLSIDEYVEPYRAGYTFEGWYTDESFTTEFVFGDGGTILRGDSISIYAKYEPISYTLTYKIYNDDLMVWEIWEYNGTPQTFTVHYNDTITEPSLIPTKVGQSFLYWCVDDSLLAKFNFESAVVKDNITLYAKWGDVAPVPDETAATAFNYIKDDSTQTVKITGVKDVNINALVIPRQIDGYDVVEIQSTLKNLPVLTVVKIPYTIATIGEGAFSGCPLIQEYQMLSASEYFKTESGVLYSIKENEGTKLYRYPAAKEGTGFTVPATVTEVVSYAFDSAQYLQNVTINAATIGKFAFKASSINNLTIGSGVSSIDTSAFRDFYSLTTVTSSTSHYQIIDGGIYNANGTILIKYFGKELNKTYSSPSNLTTINDYAFDGCSNISEINLSANVSTIGAMAFSGCTSLTTLRIAAVTGYATNNIISGCSALVTIYCHTTTTNAIYQVLLSSSEVSTNPVQFVQI
ncbi:MAG: InlB B-repeat-containing protein [Clostridia bacterium]|nr:InlB B-repeat-containing protein [Clostridia bacterium]